MSKMTKEQMRSEIDDYWTYVSHDDCKRIEEGTMTEEEFRVVLKNAANDQYDHHTISATDEARRQRND